MKKKITMLEIIDIIKQKRTLQHPLRPKLKAKMNETFRLSVILESITSNFNESIPSFIAKVEEDKVMVNDETINFNNNWIIDFECSNHMIGDKEKLSSMAKYKRKLVVVMLDNSKLPIIHVGK